MGGVSSMARGFFRSRRASNCSKNSPIGGVRISHHGGPSITRANLAGCGRSTKAKGPHSGAFAFTLPSLLHRHLGGFDRPSSDNLAGGLGLEHHLFTVERIDTLPRLGGSLLDDDELGKAGVRGPIERRGVG